MHLAQQLENTLPEQIARERELGLQVADQLLINAIQAMGLTPDKAGIKASLCTLTQQDFCFLASKPLQNAFLNQKDFYILSIGHEAACRAMCTKYDINADKWLALNDKLFAMLIPSLSR